MKVLVVTKKSLYEFYGSNLQDENIKNYLDSSKESGQVLLLRHKANSEMQERIKKKLEEANIDYDWIYRGNLDNVNMDQYDYIITVGGDGTFLEAASHNRSTPMLGIISDAIYFNGKRKGSEGFHTSANITNFEEVMDKFIKEELDITEVNRLNLELDGNKLKENVVNDIFIGNIKPESISRYHLKIGNEEETQLSSGIIIGTPLSSWAVNAGGKLLPIDFKGFQLIIRELYIGQNNPNPLFETAIIKNSPYIEITSHMRQGFIGIDGAHNRKDFSLGSKLRIYNSPHTLKILHFDKEKRGRYIRKGKIHREL